VLSVLLSVVLVMGLFVAAACGCEGPVMIMLLTSCFVISMAALVAARGMPQAEAAENCCLIPLFPSAKEAHHASPTSWLSKRRPDSGGTPNHRRLPRWSNRWRLAGSVSGLSGLVLVGLLGRTVCLHFLRLHHRDDGSAEFGQVIRLAAGDVVPIDHNRGVFPDGTGVDQVIFNAW
jgi:hypothetical protein